MFQKTEQYACEFGGKVKNGIKAYLLHDQISQQSQYCSMRLALSALAHFDFPTALKQSTFVE